MAGLCWHASFMHHFVHVNSELKFPSPCLLEEKVASQPKQNMQKAPSHVSVADLSYIATPTLDQ